MRKSYLGETLRFSIRLEDSEGADITGATVNQISVDFAFETDTVFDALTKTTEFTLEELSAGQYWLIINAALNIKSENYQIVVEADSDSGVATERYTGTVEAKDFPDGAVYVDPTAGVASNVYPAGTLGKPVSNLDYAQQVCDGTNQPADAKTLLNKIYIRYQAGVITEGAYTIDGKHIIGAAGGATPNEISMGQLTQSCIFENLKVKQATEEAQNCTFIKCVIKSTMPSENSRFLHTLFSQNSTLMSNGTQRTFCEYCTFDSANVDFANSGGTNATFVIFMGAGRMTIKNMTRADHILIIDGFTGDITRAASCTNGSVIITALNGEFDGTLGASAAVTISGSQYEGGRIHSRIQAVKGVAVTDVDDFKAESWDKIKTDHIIANSFGEVMMEIASGNYAKWKVFLDAADSNKLKEQLYDWAGAAHKKITLRDKAAAVLTGALENDKPYQRDAPA